MREFAAAKGTPAQAMAEGPQPRPLNVQSVLDLGALIYFHWRGRSYGVPPMPWKAGARLMDAYLEAKGLGDDMTQEVLPTYYGALGRMAEIIWRSTRPVGRFARVIHRLHLLRNPFTKATEAELAELALFYLGRRTKTSGITIGIRTPNMSPSLTT